MSITAALSNALTGLRASSREAELVSDNVANALTPGYTRRVAELSANVVDGRGTGVEVSAIRLASDPITLAERRRSDAALGAQDTLVNSLARISDRFGDPSEGTALASRLAEFEQALLASSNDPVSETNLTNVLSSAKQITATLDTLAQEVQSARMDADSDIADQVDTLNASLASIETLNREIRSRTLAGGDTAALLDQRKAQIDSIATIVPVRTVPREDGTVALYTKGGATLIDGPASEFEFTATPLITQGMSLANGALSGLTLNGRAVDIGNGAGILEGGSLAQLFDLRDNRLPEIANQLDGMAFEVASRFQDSAVDPTIAVGAGGLFTDGGTAVSAVTIEGLAGRLSVSAQVDPDQGGELYRLRVGLYAAAPGDSGDSTILSALYGAAIDPRVPNAGLGLLGANGLSGLAAGLTSQISGDAARAEEEQSYLAALNTELRDTESGSTGVNTDTELQRLLLVEQSYAANARVITVADQLIRRLLEI